MRVRSLTAVLAAVPLFLSATAGAAMADQITNNLDASVDAVAEIMPLNVGGPAKSTDLSVVASSDEKNGCNLTGQTILSVDVSSSDPSVATVSPSSLTFTKCGDIKTVTVTPLKPGTTTVSLTQTANTTKGTFDLAPATFTVNVTPKSNTAPAISISGVTDGARYAKGTVPAATCQVVDPEDGNIAFGATLSPVTGTYATDGIGSQTASCSYADKVTGQVASASATYAIYDPTAPSVTYTLNPATPDGTNGWYNGNVSLTWNVAEPESPNSLGKTGCANQNITTDQASTDYTCIATSAGGSTGPVTASIQRDGTPPAVAYGGVVSGTLGKNGWYITPVTVKFSATDSLSGIAPTAAAQTVTQSNDTPEAGVTLGSPAFTDLAGNTAAAGAVKSETLKVDTHAPNAPTYTLDPTPVNGWNTGDVTVRFASNGDNGQSGVASCTPDQKITVDTAGTTVSGTCVDNAGNVSDATEVTIKRDTSGPQITSAVVSEGMQGYAGWWRSDITVTFTATDTISGPDTQTADATSSGEGTAVEVDSPEFRDNAGNVTPAGTWKQTYAIDKSAPNAPTASPDPAPNANGWNNKAVTVTFKANGDTGSSGVAYCSEPVTVAAEGAGQSASGTCTDVAGNTSQSGSATVNLDLTPPVVSYDKVVGGTPGDNDWYTSPVTVQFSGTDALSGIDGDKTRTVETSEEGDNVVVDSPVFSDLAGNTASAHSAPLKIDTEAPNAPTYTLSSPSNAAGWNNHDVVVTFYPAGDHGPSDVAHCSDAVTVSTEGTQAVTGYCWDNAGNKSDPTPVTVQLDKTAPNAPTGSLNPQPNAAGWNSTDVTVSFADNGDNGPSGMASCTSPVTVSTEGANQTVTGTCTDKAGNVSDEATVTVNLDKTAPTNIQFQSTPITDGASYYYGSVPAVPSTCTATDEVSGVATCEVTGGGSPGSTGDHTLTATATNWAGLKSTAQLHYTVMAWTLKGFYAPVNMGGVWNTVKNGSTVPLKFEVFSDHELTDTSVVQSFTQRQVACPGASAATDAIEQLATTGGTSLRYDTTAGQFIQNWQTPKKPGACYQVTMTTQDGSQLKANFLLK